MKKDFITVTPDSGTGNATITVSTEQNAGDARSIQLTVSGGGMNRTIDVSQSDKYSYDPKTAPNGVYIAHTNGKIYKRDNWNVNNNDMAIGIAVKTANCSFVIAPIEQTGIFWGSSILINNCTVTTEKSVAIKDYKGEANTNAIMSTIGTISNFAAKYCRNYTFKNGKKGYLPALGELYEAYLNKSEVDACMLLIGGAALADSSIKNYRKWSSTQNTAERAWALYWNEDKILDNSKGNALKELCARPFTSLL